MAHWIADRIVVMLFYGWFMLKNVQEKAVQGHNFQPKPPVLERRQTLGEHLRLYQVLMGIGGALTIAGICQVVAFTRRP